MVWWYVAAFIVALVVAYAYSPKPEDTAQLQQVEAPTADEGREIPVLFGTRDIKQPNVVWYGDVKTVAIRKKGGKK